MDQKGLVIKSCSADYDEYAASATLALKEVFFFHQISILSGKYLDLANGQVARDTGNFPYMKQTSFIKLLLLTSLQPTLCLKQDEVPSSIGPPSLTDEATPGFLGTALLVFDLFAELWFPPLYLQQVQLSADHAGFSDVLNGTMHYSYAII